MVDDVVLAMLDRMASSMANLLANDPDWRDQTKRKWRNVGSESVFGRIAEVAFRGRQDRC
jgi:hypothetical protein